MMLNKFSRLLLGATLVVFAFNPEKSWAKPMIMENEISQIQYLAQNTPPKTEDEWGNRRLLTKLNLTTEQKDQIKKIQEKYKPQMKEVYSNLSLERNKLSEMMGSNQSVDSIRTQHQKVVALDQKAHNLRFESMLEIRSTLTPEQRKEFAMTMNQKIGGIRHNPHKPHDDE